MLFVSCCRGNGLSLSKQSSKPGVYLRMKNSQLIGVGAAILLMVSGFLNWTWYPDIHKSFTGFFSESNVYGKPGKVFIFFCIIAIIFYLIPKIWAKRWNIFLCSLTLAYAVKSFILFSGCYRGICPEKQAGIWIMLSSAALMLLAALLPDLSVNKNSQSAE